MNEPTASSTPTWEWRGCFCITAVDKELAKRLRENILDKDRLTQIIYQEMGPDAVASDLVATRLIVPINQAVQTSILKSCPELDKDHVSYCISSITGQVIHFIRAREILKKIRKPNHTFIEDTVHYITQFSLRGISSPCVESGAS